MNNISKIENKIISINDSIISALKQMDGHRTKLVFVFDKDKFEGILTIGDIQRILNLLDGKRPLGSLHVARLLLVADPFAAGNGVEDQQAAAKIVNRQTHRLLRDDDERSIDRPHLDGRRFGLRLRNRIGSLLPGGGVRSRHPAIGTAEQGEGSKNSENLFHIHFIKSLCRYQ